MKIVEYAKAHPVATGAVVIIGGIIFILIVRGGGSSSSTTSGPSDAQIAADATIQAAQINAQAGVSAAQVGAGVQLNSDNKAAEVAMAQIQAQKDLYSEYFTDQTTVAQSQIAAQAKTSQAVIAATSSPNAKNSKVASVLASVGTGQPVSYVQQQGPSSAAQIISSIGGLIGQAGPTLTSIFSDQRLKENITYAGQDKNGRNLYSFNYRGSKTKRIGYIAQDIARAEPDKVTTGKGGYARVIDLTPPRPAPASLRSF